MLSVSEKLKIQGAARGKSSKFRRKAVKDLEKSKDKKRIMEFVKAQLDCGSSKKRKKSASILEEMEQRVTKGGRFLWEEW